ncbi:MAG: hypothetical protein J3K34DRAFT_422712 [Monoraphidium minutum]|nr:MAG: hypothetical protein J3K34DRAFT_422712 [Monoraphidium minutum]
MRPRPCRHCMPLPRGCFPGRGLGPHSQSAAHLLALRVRFALLNIAPPRKGRTLAGAHARRAIGPRGMPRCFAQHQLPCARAAPGSGPNARARGARRRAARGWPRERPPYLRAQPPSRRRPQPAARRRGGGLQNALVNHCCAGERGAHGYRPRRPMNAAAGPCIPGRLRKLSCTGWGAPPLGLPGAAPKCARAPSHCPRLERARRRGARPLPAFAPPIFAPDFVPAGPRRPTPGAAHSARPALPRCRVSVQGPPLAAASAQLIAQAGCGHCTAIHLENVRARKRAARLLHSTHPHRPTGTRALIPAQNTLICCIH